MKKALFCSDLVVKKSPIHGYGVFANHEIPEGSIIEESYTLSVNDRETDLQDYYFAGDTLGLLALGFGGIYNHSHDPNALYEYEPEYRIMVFRAKRPIKKGEEIFIYYGEGWFSSRNVKAKTPSLWFRYRKLFWLIVRFSMVTGLFLIVLPNVLSI